MGNDVTNFSFESASAAVRVLEINGEPWFVAKDVLLALDYAETSINNIADRTANVPDEWKGHYPIVTPGGTQDMWCLSESGLYFFVIRSDKPKALPFQKWLAGEVIPALRKRGYYGLMPAGERMKHHGTLSRAVKQLAGSRNALEQNILLQQVEDICSLLGVKMPAVALVHAQASQLDLAEV